jgi:hypothetical protein
MAYVIARLSSIVHSQCRANIAVTALKRFARLVARLAARERVANGNNSTESRK